MSNGKMLQMRCVSSDLEACDKSLKSAAVSRILTVASFSKVEAK
jgi:hypothetical protein